MQLSRIARLSSLSVALMSLSLSACGSFREELAPGTFVLAMVFLLAFVLYYFINWKYLSTLWGLS